ncbi:MAG: cation transporter [Spirochaetia bacterium]|nr:cation transporter [Spirochaetia bacterium]
MYKTLFHIKEMDCPSEEQLIRMKLSDISSIKNLEFNLVDRDLIVFHDGEQYAIESSLESLNLGSKLVESVKYDGKVITSDQTDKKLLWTVLVINFSFFLIEAFSGFIGKSMGLVADSVDMLADALVYALALYAMSGTIQIKKRIARLSGIFQVTLAIAGFIEVIRRFTDSNDVPDSIMMMGISILALMANSASLIILNKSKSNEVHIQSSQIFTSNDVIANIGVIIAGVMVFFWKSKLPDLVVGLFVFSFVLRGAYRILKLSKYGR